MAAGAFETFGSTHLLLLAVCALGIWPMVRVGRMHRGTAGAVWFSRGFAVAIAAFTLSLKVLEYTPGRELHTILPIQLCDLAWVAAAWALWTRRAYPVALTYYWGLTLTTQAVITPALAEGFPSLRFVAFWGTHLLVVWSAVYLTWGLGLRPTWRGYRSTVLTTLVWAAVVFTINANTGTNYGFLNRKPTTPSILDLLGPWPFYVVMEIVIVLSVWALITWPWVAADRRTAVRSNARQ